MLLRTSLLAAAAVASYGQIVDAPGRAEMEKHCGRCHEVAKSVALRQDRAGWESTMLKMANMGVKGPESEMMAILEYLVKNYPADDVPPVKINECRAIELESAFSMPRSLARSVVAYREKNGPFKSIHDLAKVPGVDIKKIEAKLYRLKF